MIEKELNGTFSFYCDECGEVLETEETELKEAVNVLKYNGWRISRDTENNRWGHLCDLCKTPGVK